jgi:hypothetical protein
MVLSHTDIWLAYHLHDYFQFTEYFDVAISSTEMIQVRIK